MGPRGYGFVLAGTTAGAFGDEARCAPFCPGVIEGVLCFGVGTGFAIGSGN